jgi:hypothetical protein
VQYDENKLVQQIGSSSPGIEGDGVSSLDFIPSSIMAGLPEPDSMPVTIGTIELTKTQMRARAISERRAALIDSMPDKSLLIKDVKTVLEIRLQALLSELDTAQKRIIKDPEGYSEAKKNYRILYAEISSLEEISYESLKSRWLELIHGIK